MDLFRLVYISEKAEDVNLAELNTMIAEAQPRNRRRHLTGVLCLHKEMFFQILEGNFNWVNKLFAKISQDKRHKNIRILSMKSISERSFYDFDMHFVHDEFVFDLRQMNQLDPTNNSEYQENFIDNFSEHLCENLSKLKAKI